MPFRVTVEKFLSSVGEYWTNVYYIEAPGGDVSAVDIQGIVNAERDVLLAQATITKARVDDNVPNTDNYVTVNYNVQGNRAGAPTDTILPLYVVGRVDINAIAGRPSRKYLRCVLQESDTSMTAITGPSLTALQAYATAITAVPGLVDIDGQTFTSATVFPAPGMRQLRRGSKKKLTP